MSLNTSEAFPEAAIPSVSLLHDRYTKVFSGNGVRIDSAADIVLAREQGFKVARDAGCTGARLLILNAIISELCRNLLMYAGGGDIEVQVDNREGIRKVLVRATDSGPGIADIAKAMSSGYSTSGSLGLGLSGIQQLADETSITTGAKGTCVTVALRVM